MRFLRTVNGALLDLEAMPAIVIRDRQGVAVGDREPMELVGACSGVWWQIARGSQHHCEEVRNAIANHVKAFDPFGVHATSILTSPPLDDEDGGRRAD